MARSTSRLQSVVRGAASTAWLQAPAHYLKHERLHDNHTLAQPDQPAKLPVRLSVKHTHAAGLPVGQWIGCYHRSLKRPGNPAPTNWCVVKGSNNTVRFGRPGGEWAVVKMGPGKIRCDESVFGVVMGGNNRRLDCQALKPRDLQQAAAKPAASFLESLRALPPPWLPSDLPVRNKTAWAARYRLLWTCRCLA